MGKTTISRSSRVAALSAAVVVVGVAAPAPAQEPMPSAQPPSVHVVAPGETLWGLAQRYFGDPLLWPEIYRVNTRVVEDPHWIFPGEELRFGPAEPMPVAAAEPAPGAPVAPAPPPPPPEARPSIFRRGGGREEVNIEAIRGAAYRYKPVRRGEFYAAGFLTEGERLPWARVQGAVGTPPLRNLRATSTAQLLQEIQLTAPDGAVYQVGDTLLVARIDRDIRGWGSVVVPTGLAQVTQVAGNQLRARVIEQFNRVTDGQVALPAERFVDPGLVVPVPIQNGLMGRLVVARDEHPVAIQQDILFINLGRADGVALGDVFEVLRERPNDDPFYSDPWEALGLIQIVHTRDRSASGILTHINAPGIRSGAPVRLVRKMPS